MTAAGQYKKLTVYFLMDMRDISTIDNDEFPDSSAKPAEPEDIECSAAFIVAPHQMFDLAEWTTVGVCKG